MVRCVRAPRGEVGALLGTAAKALALAVNAPVTGAESTRLGQVRPTTPAAEEAYLQGRLHLASYGPDAAKRALDAFNRALKLDESFAAAHAGAALAYLRLGDAGVLSHADARVSAVPIFDGRSRPVKMAQKFMPRSAETMFLYDWDWAGAEREYRRSLDLNPGLVYPRTVFAQLLAARGRFEQALKISDETLLLDPQSIPAMVNHGLLL